MNNSRRPLSRRKTLQLLVILTILAWATQTLVHQWGYGQEVQPFVVTPDVAATTGGTEKFVPDDQNGPSGTLEIRGEATITGADVKLKQICHWSDNDAVTFGSIADLTLTKLSDGKPYCSITVDQVRQTLRDAGVNVALINFSGAGACTVSRSDVQVDEKTALNDWITSHESQNHTETPHEAPVGSVAATQPAAAIVPAPQPVASAAPTADQDKPHTLRDLLTADVCQRLNVDPDLIQMSYNPEDDKVLALSEPYFKFNIKPNRMVNLGGVSWDIIIVSDSGADKKVSISALARAWQVQTIVSRPLAYKQLLQDGDFMEKRILVDSLPDTPLLPEQCVGQQAARDLKPGMVMTARMVDPVPLVRTGQLVTVTVTEGTVQIKAVARAIESGALGQTIKVRNETTRDVFEVTVTGQQEARLGGGPPGSDGVASVGN